MTNFLTQYHDIQASWRRTTRWRSASSRRSIRRQERDDQGCRFDNIPAVQPLIKGGKDAGDRRAVRRQKMGGDGHHYVCAVGRREFTGWVKTDVKLTTAAICKRVSFLAIDGTSEGRGQPRPSCLKSTHPRLR